MTPFANGPSDTPNDVLTRIGEGKFDLSTGNWCNISDAAKVCRTNNLFQKLTFSCFTPPALEFPKKDLVTKMLHMDPTKRLKAVDILNHKWIKQRDKLPYNSLPQNTDPKVIRASMSLVFEVINKPLVIPLNPVKTSELAKRRAKRNSFQSVKNE